MVQNQLCGKILMFPSPGNYGAKLISVRLLDLAPAAEAAAMTVAAAAVTAAATAQQPFQFGPPPPPLLPQPP